MRGATVKRLREEALEIYPRTSLKNLPTYPEHFLRWNQDTYSFELVSGGQASNPYKNHIRNYRKFNK